MSDELMIQDKQIERQKQDAIVLDPRMATDQTNAMERAFAIVTHEYITRLKEYPILKYNPSENTNWEARLFSVNKLVYAKKEDFLQKATTMLYTAYASNAKVITLIQSDGKDTKYHLGVVYDKDEESYDKIGDTFKSSLCGNFQGSSVNVLDNDECNKLRQTILSNEGDYMCGAVSAISGVPSLRMEDKHSIEGYVQGIENLTDSLQGVSYTLLVCADPIQREDMIHIRQSYEAIYTQLSAFEKTEYSFQETDSISTANSTGHSDSHSDGKTKTTSKSSAKGTSKSDTEGSGKSTTKDWSKLAGLAGLALGAAAVCLAPALVPALAGTAAVSAIAGATGATAAGIAGGAIVAGTASVASAATSALIGSKTTNTNNSKTEGTTETETDTTSNADTETDAHTVTTNETNTNSTSGGRTIQFTVQNKEIINILKNIEDNLERLKECDSFGTFNCSAYVLSNSLGVTNLVSAMYDALMRGEKSASQVTQINTWSAPDAVRNLVAYLQDFQHPQFDYNMGELSTVVTPALPISGKELALQIGLPKKSISGLTVMQMEAFGRNPIQAKNGLQLGKIYHMGQEDETRPVTLDTNNLASHTFITGSTGSGKSNTVYEILNQLRNVYNIPFLVIEPAKGEYKNVFGQFADVSVYGTNPKKFDLLRINPFRFPSDIHVLEHLDRLVELFNVCWPMYAAMPAILKEAMEKAYVAAGWNISTSENPRGEVFPNFADLLEQIESTIMESKYSVDSKGDYSGALCTRVRSLTNGLNGMIFTSDDLSDADLFDKHVIVDLSRVGSTETKSLIMGLLVMKLNEYRMTSAKTNSPLTHITVLEEAHNLLKRTSTEQSSEGANLLGKSVELLSNSIAEMRTYGEGFIIVDQSPGLLDMSVIRNTNTKIILRLPEQSDRELVGFAASLDEKQIGELSKLERGVAAVYQNDWVEPVLVKIDKCDIEEKEYVSGGRAMLDVQNLRKQLIYFLIQGRIGERLDFDVNEIEKNLGVIGLSSRDQEFLEEQIAEYKCDNKLILWSETEFAQLSRRLTDLLGVRTQVENAVLGSADNTELTKKLSTIVKQFLPSATTIFTLALSQCFMRDFYKGKEESDIRERIYKQWVDSARESEAKL